MLDKIHSKEKFEPKESLKTKYWLYVISVVALFWAFVLLIITVVAVVDGIGFTPALLRTYGIIIVIGLVIITIGYFIADWYYRSVSYEIVEDEVHVFRGIITRTRKIVPYRTITNLDVKQGPFDRFFNLGTIEIQTAGNSANKMGPEERLDGLPGEFVEQIQEFLVNKVRKMRGSAGVTHDIPDEQSLLTDILHEVKELRKQLRDRN